VRARGCGCCACQGGWGAHLVESAEHGDVIAVENPQAEPHLRTQPHCTCACRSYTTHGEPGSARARCGCITHYTDAPQLCVGFTAACHTWLRATLAACRTRVLCSRARLEASKSTQHLRRTGASAVTLHCPPPQKHLACQFTSLSPEHHHRFSNPGQCSAPTFATGFSFCMQWHRWCGCPLQTPVFACSGCPLQTPVAARRASHLCVACRQGPAALSALHSTDSTPPAKDAQPGLVS